MCIHMYIIVYMDYEFSKTHLDAHVSAIFEDQEVQETCKKRGGLNMAASSSSVSLSNLGGGSYVSNAALANVLKNIKEDPTVLEAGSSRWAVKRKREKDVRVSTFFGPLMQSMTLSMLDGSNMEAWFVHPICLLDHLIQTSAWFAGLMASTMQQFPGEWNLVWYADEVTPGNALRPLNHRKTLTGQDICTCFYFPGLGHKLMSSSFFLNKFCLYAMLCKLMHRGGLCIGRLPSFANTFKMIWPGSPSHVCELMS